MNAPQVLTQVRFASFANLSYETPCPLAYILATVGVRAHNRLVLILLGRSFMPRYWHMEKASTIAIHTIVPIRRYR